METKSKSAKEKTEYEISISRLINAPVEMVYKAFTEPQQLAQWFGPYGFTNPVCELEVKVGGKWNVVQKGPDGALYKFHGIYKELVKNKRIVWTFTFEDFRDGESTGIFTFEDKDGKTLLTSTTIVHTKAEYEGLKKFGATEGTKQTLQRLEEFIGGNVNANKELHIVRLLNAPRELVWEMWTDPEHIKHWWGPRGFINTIYKMDVKEGGEWEFTMHGPNGTDYENKNIFKEIVKHEKLVLLHGHEPVFHIEVWFIPQGDKTLLSMRSQFDSAEVLQRAIKEVGAAEGFKQNIEKLEEYLNQIQKANTSRNAK